MRLKVVGSNQTEIEFNNGAIVLFSYETPVAAVTPDGEVWHTEQYYSRTTTKHVNSFLEARRGKGAYRVPQEFLDGMVGEG